MRLENDDGLSELLASGEETRLCTGFEFTEGPIWVAAAWRSPVLGVSDAAFFETVE